jgi:hypothetical protein
MEQYRKPNMFFKKWIVFISKQTNFNIRWFGLDIYYFGRNKMNQSIDYVRVENPFLGRTGSMNYVENRCFESKVF